jgi:hypothetical protein
MAEQQFPDWIEKYRATIPQSQQEKISKFELVVDRVACFQPNLCSWRVVHTLWIT